MSAQLAPLSASVTRILSLTGFPKELKTKDIQAAFSDWENASGGFRIKWIDDTSLMIVFNDAGIAKRAYLRSLCVPPPSIFDASPVAAIRPYDGPDAQSIIQNVNSRHQSNASRSHNVRASVSLPNGHSRMASTSVRNGHMKHANGIIPEHQVVSISTDGMSLHGREPSPTLPSVPSHPTLSSMISSSSSFGEDAILNDPAILAAGMAEASGGSAPRIGDPGKRMLGAALGVRHPSLGPRNLSGGTAGGADQMLMKEVQKAMGGLTVSD
ncbi:hypothetical protein M0805_000954 [Coniferiporia weirii]|nr:hypothetical protein M0805_000954 [Coniferiporia weirii]